MMSALEIGPRRVAPGEPCLIIGEVAQAHDGSLGLAHAFIDAIADAGADAVKFQTHIAAAESTPAEPWRITFSTQDASRYDYWKRMEFSEAQWGELAEHARRRGLLFLSSPFSVQAAVLLSRVGVPAWKIASGEATNRPLLEQLARTRLPFLVSTGMSDFTEIDELAAWLRAQAVPFALLQCTSAYPCGPEQLGLNVLAELRSRHGCPVGLSDHSGKIYASLAAAALGVELLEVHVTLSREMFGPDVAVSVTTAELRQLVEGVRWIEQARAHPVDKDAVARDLAPMRALFTKSIVAARDLPPGTRLEPSHLAVKKPGTGLPASRLPEPVGRRLRRRVRTDEHLRLEDLEPAA